MASPFSSNIDKSNFFPIVGISSMTSSESQRLNVVAVSASGVRFYFTVTGNNPMERPTNLSLQHIRLPPGFAASSSSGKPNRVHTSYYKNGDKIAFYLVVWFDLARLLKMFNLNTVFLLFYYFSMHGTFHIPTFVYLTEVKNSGLKF